MTTFDNGVRGAWLPKGIEATSVEAAGKKASGRTADSSGIQSCAKIRHLPHHAAITNSWRAAAGCAGPGIPGLHHPSNADPNSVLAPQGPLESNRESGRHAYTVAGSRRKPGILESSLGHRLGGVGRRKPWGSGGQNTWFPAKSTRL